MIGTLSVLDLSNNSLTGGIPESFGNSPALESLNVSYNTLQGPVPENGMLRTINPKDLAGNRGLCGNVLPPCTGNIYNSRHRDSHTTHIIAGWLIGTSVILAVVITTFAGKSLFSKFNKTGLCFKPQFEMGKNRAPVSINLISKTQIHKHRYPQLYQRIKHHWDGRHRSSIQSKDITNKRRRRG
ncbi:putative non-specific serine/threonine protein kinase [Helianthus annuus]|nr:putative non-specific serine/threonine protein kinase [Helianthus annuus]